MGHRNLPPFWLDFANTMAAILSSNISNERGLQVYKDARSGVVPRSTLRTSKPYPSRGREKRRPSPLASPARRALVVVCRHTCLLRTSKADAVPTSDWGRQMPACAKRCARGADEILDQFRFAFRNLLTVVCKISAREEN